MDEEGSIAPDSTPARRARRSPRRPPGYQPPARGVVVGSLRRRRPRPEEGHVLMPGVRCELCADLGPCRAWTAYLERPCDACGGDTELRVTGGGLRLYHVQELEPLDHRPVPELDVEGDLPS